MVPVSFGAGAEGIEQSRVADVLLVQTFGSSFPWICTLAEVGEVDVNHSIVDLVQHRELVVQSVSFKTVPFQIVKQQLFVLSQKYSPDVILFGWLGSKHQLTN